MSHEQISSRKMAEELLVQKATDDAAFRQELLTDAKAAIGRTLGIRFPNEIKITVLEENAQNLYLVLPVQQAKTGELAEAELAMAVGGVTLQQSAGTWGKINPVNEIGNINNPANPGFGV